VEYAVEAGLNGFPEGDVCSGLPRERVSSERAQRSLVPQRVLCALLGWAMLASSASADVTTTGDVDPADPTTWTVATYAYIGKTGAGTVAANGGSDLDCEGAYWISPP